MIDPSMLYNSSAKFVQLVQPFGARATQCQLVILRQGFSERCIDNFLKLVLDSEMKEICEIAKMFQSEQIYQTGLNFIQKSIGPSFFVPENSKFDAWIT